MMDLEYGTFMDYVSYFLLILLQGTGGTLMFIQQSALLLEEIVSDKTKVPENRLLFLNGDHEYVVFNPYNGNDDEAHATPIIRFTSVKEQGESHNFDSTIVA